MYLFEVRETFLSQHPHDHRPFGRRHGELFVNSSNFNPPDADPKNILSIVPIFFCPHVQDRHENPFGTTHGSLVDVALVRRVTYDGEFGFGHVRTQEGWGAGARGGEGRSGATCDVRRRIQIRSCTKFLCTTGEVCCSPCPSISTSTPCLLLQLKS